MKDTASKTLTLKTLNKSNVWDIQENDIFRMVESAQKDADLKDNMRHYLDIITRVTDLTYENIGHISAAKLIEVLDRNFGGGWDSLSQSIQDIIQHGFDISTTTLPSDRLHKKGGMYEKKVADGYEVLEIQKGSWTEAIFAKEKPKVERQRTKFEVNDEEEDILDDENYDEEEEIVDNYNNDDEDDDFDEDKLTEESYRTTIEEDPDSLSLEAADIVDEEDY